jgi:hypothetical protein
VVWVCDSEWLLWYGSATLCGRMKLQDVADDLEDLAIFVQHRKIPWVTAKAGQSKTNEEFTAFINKQLATIRGLRKVIPCLCALV